MRGSVILKSIFVFLIYGEKSEQIFMDTTLAEKGKEFYEKNLKTLLEPQQNGDFVAIEPESGQYFVGKTTRETMDKAHSKMPDKKFYLQRIGYTFAHSFGGLRRANG